MKSITIKDAKGLLLIKVLETKKNGYEFTCSDDLIGKITIDVRDGKGCKVYHKFMRTE